MDTVEWLSEPGIFLSLKPLRVRTKGFPQGKCAEPEQPRGRVQGVSN